jgi:hypothetical protein
MKRVPIPLLVVAVMGGCMAIEPDPIEDTPYVRPQRVPPQTQSQSWSYLPQSAKVALQNANNKTENTLVKASDSPPVQPSLRDTNKKAENALVKAAYTEPKPVQDESPPTSLGMLRLTSNKRIIFHLDSSGAASPAAANLEIWGTTDMRSWKKYQAEARSPSSLSVVVKDEGLYGFTMIARGKGEPSTEQPPAGEPPQVWVAVDLTKPVVKLLEAEMNAQSHTPALMVRWNAKDRNFGAQPITVVYAESPEGPWRPLAANLENSGRYEGSLPPHLGDSVYLRVQAADLMGNVTMSQMKVLRTPSRSSTSAARVAQPDGPALSVDGE